MEWHACQLFGEVGFVNGKFDQIVGSFHTHADIGRSDFDGLHFAARGGCDLESRVGIFEANVVKDRDLLRQLIGAQRCEIDIGQGWARAFGLIGDPGDCVTQIGLVLVAKVDGGANNGEREKLFHDSMGWWKIFSGRQTQGERALW